MSVLHWLRKNLLRVTESAGVPQVVEPQTSHAGAQASDAALRMTEADWLAWDHPAALLLYLRGKVAAEEKAASRCRLGSHWGELFPGPSPFTTPDRFARFGTACAARLRALPLREATARYLDTFERHLHGQATLAQLHECFQAMHAETRPGERCAENYLYFTNCDSPLMAGLLCWNLAGAIAWTVARNSIEITCANATEEDWFEWGFAGGPPDPLFQSTQRSESRMQADLLRDIIGNPFRPVSCDPAWRTPTVIRLAHIAYAECTPDNIVLEASRLTILADALEDAGCTNADLLGHLRGVDFHVRGCWAVDWCAGLTAPTHHDPTVSLQLNGNL